MATNRVTEKKTIKIIDPTNWESPVALYWVNKLGGWSCWVFNGKFQEQDRITRESKTLNTESFVGYRPFRHDLEYIEAWSSVLEREIQQGFTVSAEGVTADQRDRIRGIVHSNMVVMLLNPSTWDTIVSGSPVGPKWERVMIDGNNYDFGDPNFGTYDISFKIIRQPTKTLNR